MANDIIKCKIIFNNAMASGIITFDKDVAKKLKFYYNNFLLLTFFCVNANHRHSAIWNRKEEGKEKLNANLV